IIDFNGNWCVFTHWKKNEGKRMKEYRVGTWTLGLVLIAIGIAGIVSIFNEIYLIEWPFY
ncbi:MAG TPA: hypothetical protein VLA13_11020, partial [Massilibacterium sp.]|nr:hypothetical protein [Massilibacterium sp.]